MISRGAVATELVTERNSPSPSMIRRRPVSFSETMECRAEFDHL